MHPSGQGLVLLGVVVGVVPGELGLEAGAVAVPVDLVGEEGQGAQGDAVAGLNDLQIVVVDGVGEHRGHQGAAAGGGAHPQHIMVAPLDVHVVVLHEGVHDDVRPGTSIEHVAHHVEPVHHHAFDEVAHGDNEALGLVNVDDGGDDVLIVVPLVVELVVGVEQLINDVGVLLGQSLPDFGTGVLGGDQTADVDEPMEGDAVPLLQLLRVFRLSGDHAELFLGIVDEGSQLVPFRLGNAGGEEGVHLLPDHAGGRIEDVKEGLIFAVYVGDEVLGALGQVQDGLQVDDLTASGLDSGILTGEHLQIAQVWGRFFHPAHSFCVVVSSPLIVPPRRQKRYYFFY